MTRYLAVAVMLASVACHRASEHEGGGGTAVHVEPVKRGDLVERVVLTGELRAGVSIELNCPKTDAWQLTIRWMAEDGAVVKQGDRVLEFDNSAFTSGLEQKRMAAKTAVTTFHTFSEVSAMATQDKEFELRQHQIALEKVKILASVPADLLPQRTAQERQLEKLKTEVAVAKAEKDLVAQRSSSALEERVKKIDLDKAQHSIEDADKAITELVMRAPRDGVISVGENPWKDRKFTLGDNAQPGMTILTLPDFTQPMEVRADLSDVDDGRVTNGMVGTCTLDAYPREALPCQVVDLAPVARSKSRQSLRRSFGVKLDLAHSDPERMRPGMSVKIELLRPPVVNALLVPRGALVIDPKQARVRLANGDLADVTLGACDAQRCVALTGVTEGQSLAIGGTP